MQEGRHRAARALCYGQKGALPQHYQEGQEDQLAALGLLLNVVILWNTRYTQRALDARRTSGGEVRPDDVPRLSLLGLDHITILGRYQFMVPDAVRCGDFRSLRSLALASSPQAKLDCYEIGAVRRQGQWLAGG